MKSALRGSRALVSLPKSRVLPDAAIDQLTFVLRDINVSAGASAGVALLVPEADGEAVLVRADKATHVRKTA